VIGLFNLRGDLVTLVDLAARLGTPRSEVAECAIVVLSADGRTLGLEVDEVVEVADGSSPEWTGSTPSEGIPGTFISGTGHFGDMVVLEVDVLELVRQTLT
jgi:chemotaxis signal transduction protein